MQQLYSNGRRVYTRKIATNFSSRFSQKNLFRPPFAIIFISNESQRIATNFFFSLFLSLSLSLFFFATMKRWKFTERWTESNNIRGSCHHRQLLFFNWRPRTRLRTPATPRERRRRVPPPLPRARVPVKKLAWKFFQLKTVGAHRDEVRATARSRERDATRRVATPRAALAPLVGAERGEREKGGG